MKIGMRIHQKKKKKIYQLVVFFRQKQLRKEGEQAKDSLGGFIVAALLSSKLI